MRHSTAKAVPPERILAYQDKQGGFATVVVTRDAGVMMSHCYIGLVVAGTLAARFDPEETATFYIPAGESEMAVVSDPQGWGLCSAGLEPVPEHYLLKADTPNYFRISLGLVHNRLLPSDFW